MHVSVKCVFNLCMYLRLCVNKGKGVKAELTQGSGKWKAHRPSDSFIMATRQGRGLCCFACCGLALGQFCHRSRFSVVASLLLQARRVNDAFKNNKMSTEGWIPLRQDQNVHQFCCLDSVCEAGLWVFSAAPRGFPKEWKLSVHFLLPLCLWTAESKTTCTTAHAVSGYILFCNSNWPLDFLKNCGIVWKNPLDTKSLHSHHSPVSVSI